MCSSDVPWHDGVVCLTAISPTIPHSQSSSLSDNPYHPPRLPTFLQAFMNREVPQVQKAILVDLVMGVTYIVSVDLVMGVVT